MPLGIEPDDLAIAFGLFVILVEIVKAGKILQASMAPGIERNALAFF